MPQVERDFAVAGVEAVGAFEQFNCWGEVTLVQVPAGLGEEFGQRVLPGGLLAERRRAHGLSSLARRVCRFNHPKTLPKTIDSRPWN